MSQLAINGGKPIRVSPFKKRTTIGADDKKAAIEVLEEGNLSLFFGSPGKYFLGGKRVLEFERKWSEKYNYNHCITVNSWTTGLMTAIGACGIGPGDEVICPPYSMSATSTSILFYGGIPVFVDIEDETFNLDPKLIEKAITPRTKAIMVVHLFGHPADMDSILKIAKKYSLKVIEDAAHAPGVRYKGKYVGAIGDIGGFSLNYHKHVHTGEGGVLVTNNPDLAFKSQLIRNHGENVIEAYNIEDLTNVIGSNYRLTEIQAAIGSVQLDKIENCVSHRNNLHKYFSNALKDFKGITPPVIKDDCEHAFYCYSLKFDEKEMGVSRNTFLEAVAKELPVPEISEQTPFIQGYLKPLYWNPIYQKKIAIGNKGFPFNFNPGVEYNYQKGICPTVERMYEKELFWCPLVRESVEIDDLKDVVNAITKVYESRKDLEQLKV